MVHETGTPPDGTVTLGGATLTLNLTYAPTAATPYTIIANDGTDPVTGTFANVPANGGTITASYNSAAYTFRVFYTGGDGNDVVLVEQTADPFPVYVDEDWAGCSPGQFLTDADDGTPADEFAVFGVNAFAAVADGLAAVADNRTLIVNHGTYPAGDLPSLADGKTLRLTRKDQGGSSSTITLASLDSALGTTIDLDGNTLSLGNSDAINNTLAGTIDGSGGSLTKQGTNTLTLSGTNTYTGATAVPGGKLLVNGSITSNTTVTHPAILGGTGKVAGNVSGTGTVSPGTSIESLEITGDYTPAGPTSIEIRHPYGANDFDQLIVGGTLNLGGGTLTLSASGAAAAPGNQLKIFDHPGSDSVTPFSGLAEGDLVSSGNYSGRISYLGGDGNDVVLTSDFTSAAVVTGTPGNDAFEVRRIGSTIQVLRAGAGVVFSAPLASLSSLQIDGGDGDDSLLVNCKDDATTDGYFDLDVTFNGQGQATTPHGDRLTIDGPGADGIFDSVTFNHTTAHDGNVTVVEAGATSVISYTGLDSVIVGGSARQWSSICRTRTTPLTTIPN